MVSTNLIQQQNHLFNENYDKKVFYHTSSIHAG